MTQKADRPATLRGSEQAENRNLACQQIEVLISKSALNLQPRSLVSYEIDVQLNVIHVQFSPSPSRWEHFS